ncbi:MAG: D-glycero-beta-D-manno-heptose 1,7-bisphosphate 7-phosphatase [Pseudomonadota bacterium]
MPFILLDRDGVINHDSVEYIKSPEEWLPIDGSLEAIARFNQAGYQVIVATNQSGLARGLYDLPTLTKIHQKFFTLLAEAGGKVEEIFFCPHHPNNHCSCRKPEPGMLHNIAKKYPIDLTTTIFIGDSLSDVQAAERAGCEPVLVLTGNGKRTLEELPAPTKVRYFNDLAHAATIICKK